MSQPRIIDLVLVAMALAGALALGCSSGDDGATDAAAAADSGAAGAEADPDAAAVEQYALVQQFDLSIAVTSTKFNEERRIPRKYSCTEEDVSVPITWSEVPEGTVSLALVVESDQFPGAPWVHWVLWGIPPDARGLVEAVPNTAEAPAIGPEARQGTNSDEKVGWSGPCPPLFRVEWGGRQGAQALAVKHYTFRLYALDTEIDLGPETAKAEKVGWSGPCPPAFTLHWGDGKGAQKLAVKHYWFRLYALDTEIDLGPEATKEDLLRAIDGHILVGGELVGEHVSKKKISGSF
jgi:Raf kinase inhibitor-like YbhB/YbcL family protein